MGAKVSIIISEDDKQKIIKAYTIDNLSVTEICRIGLFPGTRHTLAKRLVEWNIPIKNRETRLQDNLEEIIKLWKSGVSLCKLQEQFHISKKTISDKLKQLGFNIQNPQLELQFNEHIFDSIDTEEKAYWLGFIFADGNISSVKNVKKKTEYIFTLSLKESDKEHLQKFNTFMEHKKDNRHYHKSKHPSCQWYINNYHLWNTLNSYGCVPKKSLILKFPELSIFKDQSLIRHFIRGYFDGDGCFSQDKIKSGVYPRLSLLGTLEFVEKVNSLCECSGTITEQHSANTYYNLRFNRKNSIKFMHYIYDNCTIYLDRKYSKYAVFKDDHIISYKVYDDNIEVFSNYS